MQIALDTYMFRDVPLLELPALVADLGYEWIELSPREDFIPFFRHPRVDLATVRRFRKALESAGVGVCSTQFVQRWSGPGEDERKQAVRNIKRILAVTTELGVPVVQSEFNGRPELPEASEARFFDSLEELLPVLESEGVELRLEPHPDDFVEDGFRAVDLVRGIDRPCVGFVYCTPHTFHQGGDGPAIIRYAGDLVRHVHVADTFDPRASSGLRYIVNPPGSTARIHQHLNIGEGEVDFDGIFAALEEVGFSGALCSSVFAWEEKAEESSRLMRKRIQEHVDRWKRS
ncbi:TIM barrel protein [Kineococcus sp. T13]|uniref:sugar phosphate isomerase/epimerase family protein n=1 Tax=Kineococcus vitellinus TaxID=2696565 RepID=UPI0014125294|nr:TIM barrel protein [Kineococcus vitellinus]